MFNEDIKRRYIEYKESVTIMSVDFLQRVFRSTEPFEKELNKDIADFTASEIINYYQYINKSSADSLTALNSTLSLYTQWYIGELLSKDHQNHFLELGRETFVQCTNKAKIENSIIKREDLLQRIAELPNPCDQFILLCLFEGISGKGYSDILNINYSDFHDGMADLPSGRTIKVSDELYKLASKARNEDFYIKMSPGLDLKVKFVDSEDRIVKDLPNAKPETSAKQKGKRVYARLVRLFKYIGLPWLTGNNLIESGKIHFITKRCEELGISAYDYLFSDRIQEVNNQFGCRLVRSNFYSVYEEYLP